MKSQKAAQFALMLGRQSAGNPEARDSIASLPITLEDGYCLWNLYEQWKGAFSYAPGRADVLDAIKSLAEKIAEYPKDDTLKMYGEPEWARLVAARGPFDNAVRYTCAKCGVTYVGFGQSGFDDRYPAVCDCCGNVWLQSGYDRDPLPKCACGGMYRTHGCPRCREAKFSAREEFSSYEYFATHRWTEKAAQPGATDNPDDAQRSREDH